MSVIVRNPHSILAAIQTRPRDIFEIFLPPRAKSEDAWKSIIEEAHRAGVKIAAYLDSGGAKMRDEHRRERNERHEQKRAEGLRSGAGEARIKERDAVALEELFKDAKDRAGGHGLWLALDTVQDPHNVGAIFRTAAFFGVQGVVITQDRSAPLGSAAYDAASGGIEHVPYTMQVNLVRALEHAKEAGVWVLGASEHAKESHTAIKPDRPWLLVLGNEEDGMRRLTAENCDQLCSIKPAGDGVTSLNVSAAAAVMISRLAGPDLDCAQNM